jgi:tyrosyl-tRNA synthetase
MSAADLIRLAAQANVARMLERKDFAARYKASKTISVHEFLYPLAQAQDSIALAADVELGGTDQKFNLLAGRELQKHAGQSPQSVVMTPLLEGLDGRRKMSKSLANHIGIAEDAPAIYGKLMSISDDLMWRYFLLLSQRSEAEIAKMKEEVCAGRNPKEIKQILALELAARFAGDSEAQAAAKEFDERFRRHKTPAEIKEETVRAAGGKIPLAVALYQAGVVKSASEARRKIIEGAVYVIAGGAETKVNDPKEEIASGGAHTLRVGRRRFIRIRVV